MAVKNFILNYYIDFVSVIVTSLRSSLFLCLVQPQRNRGAISSLVVCIKVHKLSLIQPVD